MVLWPAAFSAVAPLAAQTRLEDAASRARQLWLAHDTGQLVSGSDTVRLQLPGSGSSGALGPGQAARLLARYLEPAGELGFQFQGIRLAGDRAYAEGRRRYVVEGTSEERAETVFLGFRLVGGVWRLSEVRIVR